MKTNVYSLVSPRTGRAVPNQFVVVENGIKYFKSYKTIIARVKKGVVTLDREKWSFSKTTVKYLCEFLQSVNINCYGINDVREAIANNKFELKNLNK